MFIVLGWNRRAAPRDSPVPVTKPQICVSTGVVLPCSSTGKRNQDPAPPFANAAGQRRTFGCRGKIFGSYWLVAMGFAMFVTLCEGVRVGNRVIWARNLEIIYLTVLKLF